MKCSQADNDQIFGPVIDRWVTVGAKVKVKKNDSYEEVVSVPQK